MTSRSVVYRERDTEREWDEQPRKSYTTVKRYQVPESSTLSPVEQDTTKEKITIRRERSAQPASREEDYRYSDTRIRESDRDRGGDDSWNVKITERTRDSDARSQHDDYRYSDRHTERDTGPRQNVTYTRYSDRDDYDDRRSVARSDHRSSYQTDYRYTERDREVARAPDPPTQNRVSEFRFERERDFSPPERSRHHHHDDYEVERYVKETDYYTQPSPQPQPIIIRERAPPAPAPIIIREERRDPAPIIIRERREPQYEFIERREVEEEKQLVKREETPPPAPQAPPQQDEDYFYERRVIERERPRSRDHRSEIRPKDSASNYSSDDSYEYVRRERTVYDDDYKDHHHKRHLAEGVLAGVAGAEILRHHRKSEGKEGGGRLKSAVGGALVGGVGAEVLSRARSRHRSRARSRSSSRSSSRSGRRDRRRRNRSRSRSGSRSKSLSKKQIAGLAGVAAAGALAGYVINKRKNNETVIVNERSPPRRSRSRRRRGSDDSSISGGDDDKHRDPDHRNKRIAQAGLASAAAAGIWEKVRSKSRGGGKDRERSKSRVRQAVPVVGAGLGGAALAGLWEKNKANKEAKRDMMIEEQTGRGRRRRSRSRSRSVPDSNREDRRNVNGRNMIAYGGDPISPSQRSYYSDEEPGVYNRRHGGGSVGSSPDERRRSSRSRSRGKGLAEAGAAAGIGAVAAHEYGKRKERKRAERERENQGRDDGYYDDRYGHDDRYGPSPGPYSPEPPSGYLPPQQNAGYPTQQPTYPGGAYFPPPPTGENVYAHTEPYPNQQQQQATYPPYNPADYMQPGAQPTPYNNTRNAYSEQNLGAPYSNDTFAGDTRYAAEEHPDEGRGRGHNPPPEHVSAPVDNSNATIPNNSERDAQDADGVSTPRARSTSRVRFNLDANQYNSPETPKKRVEERFSDSETTNDRKRRHRRRKHRDRGRDDDGASRDSPQLMNDKYERAPKDNDSDTTEDLPDRFDKDGNPRHESDPFEQLLGGLASRFLGGGGDDEERHGRRRHRH